MKGITPTESKANLDTTLRSRQRVMAKIHTPYSPDLASSHFRPPKPQNFLAGKNMTLKSSQRWTSTLQTWKKAGLEHWWRKCTRRFCRKIWAITFLISLGTKLFVSPPYIHFVKTETNFNTSARPPDIRFHFTRKRITKLFHTLIKSIFTDTAAYLWDYIGD